MLTLDGAGTRDHLNRLAAERHAWRDSDHGALGAPFPRHLLVRLGDVNDLGDAGQRLDARAVHAAVVADETDGGALAAGHGARLVAHFFYRLDDALDLLRRRLLLHDYEHLSPRMWCSIRRARSPSVHGTGGR